jgi:hypothetical protein
MTEIAVLTCEACPFDGDASFHWRDTFTPWIIWDCPTCGFENQQELDLTDYDAGRDCDD